MRDVKAVARAAALLQEAALGNAPMSLFVETVAQLVGADKGLLAAASGTVDGVSPFAAFHFPDEAVRDYNTHFSTRDAFIQTLAAQRQPRSVNIGSEIWERRTYRRSEIYNEFYRHHDVEWGCSLSTRERLPGGVPRLQLSLARGGRGTAFGADEKRVLEALSPQFDAAAPIVLERRARAHASLAAAFEQSADALALIDGDGRVRYANAAFDDLRRHCCGAGLRHWSTPLATPPLAAARQALRDVQADARRGPLAARQFSLSLAADGSLRRYAGSVATALAAAGVALRPGEPLFLLLLREDGAREAEQIAALRQRYRLTAMEARVLAALAEGEDAAAIAGRFRLSLHTVRSHLKALLAKTHCRRQAQLLCLLRNASTGRLRLLC